MAVLNGTLSLRDLAVLAAGCLLVDDARLYGLIDGDLGIDRQRCRAVLRQAEAAGIVADSDEAAAAALHVMAELGAVRS